MSRFIACSLLLLLPSLSLAGEAVDHQAPMLGWWFFEQEPEERCDYNRARQFLESNPSDDDAQSAVEDFEEEGATRLRVERGRAAAVMPDGDEDTFDFEVVSADADGLLLAGREDLDDDPEHFRVAFGPAGRMVWSHAEDDDKLHFRRLVDASSLVGEWGIKLSGAELQELEEARRSVEANPEDESSRMMLEMMESMLESLRLTVSATEMVLSFGEESERVTWTSRERGGRLELTTTDSDGEVEAVFVVFENDGSMAWSKQGDVEIVRFQPR